MRAGGGLSLKGVTTVKLLARRRQLMEIVDVGRCKEEEEKNEDAGNVQPG